MSILGKYKRWNDLLVTDTSEYYDFVLTQDSTPSIPYAPKMTERCLISFIDCNLPQCIDDKGLISHESYKWDNEKCINNGIELQNIGLVGIDTSNVTYDKDKIDRDTFKGILTTTEPFAYPLEIEKNDFKFHMDAISGNTKQYSYEMEQKNGFFSLKGGFFQGFFKIFGKDYQVLPNVIDNCWHFEFVLRPQDYAEPENSLNNTHNKAKGIFFYLGTRAENKFAQFYNGNKECKDEITTKSGDNILKRDIFKIQTDNKYLFFDRTKDGFTTNNWDQCDIVELEGENKTAKVIVTPNDCENKAILTDNMYLFMNRTKDGYTVNDLDKLYEASQEKYDTQKDILNNAFALRIDENGHIGYQYLIKNCDKDEGYELLEEYSDLFTFENGKWYTINVKMKILNGNVDKCGNTDGRRLMKIYIYINGYLKFISRPIPELLLRELNDSAEKQEGVPFNISLGGGTQGLGESVWLDDMDGNFAPRQYLENNFAGTFIGDISSFKFYDCALEYAEIMCNYLYNTEVLAKKNYLL